MKLISSNNFSLSFKKIIKNTGFLTGEKIINLIISLFTGIFVARYLGPENFGMLRYSVSLVGLVGPVALLGTKQIVIRDLVKKPEKENEILGTTFSLILISSIFLSLFISIVGWLLNKDSNIIQILIIINAVNLTFNSFLVFDYWFKSKILGKHTAIAKTTGKLLSFIIKIILIFLGLSVIYFAIAMVIGSIIKILLWLSQYTQYKDGIKNWKFNKDYAINLIMDTWPLILSSVSVAIYMKVDQIMIKEMLNSNLLGNYSVSVKLSESWYFIPSAVCSSIFPIIIKSKQKSIKLYKKRLQYVYDIMSGIAIFIAIPVTFLHDQIIFLLFGSDYNMAGPVLAVHIWAAVFVFLGIARSNWIINENYQKYGMIFTFAGAISNILLNLILVPMVGIMGAAIATVISQMISAWFLSILFSKTRLAFYMQSKSILRAITVYPLINSIKNIYKESQQ